MYSEYKPSNDLTSFTSAQLVSVMDFLLYNAIDPIIEHTTMMDRMMSYVLSFAQMEPRRKISSDKGSLPTRILQFLTLPQSSHKKRSKLIREMKLERSILYYCVDLFLKMSDGYEEKEVAATRLTKFTQEYTDLSLARKELDETLGTVGSIFAARSRAKFWINRFYSFKNDIEMRYSAYVEGVARGYTKDKPDLDTKEVAQNMMIYVSKAIDKFDESKGSITSYIQIWTRKAMLDTKLNQQYGAAYSIPQKVKKKIVDGLAQPNFRKNVDLEDLDTVLDAGESIEMEAEEKDRDIRMLAKIADPSGIGRILMGIREILNEKEIQILAGGVR